MQAAAHYAQATTSGRVAVCSLDALRCRKGFYRAGHSVARASSIDRVNLVVVSRLCPEALHAHAKHRVGMGRVQPDVGLCRLAQVFCIRTVVHHAEVLVTASRVSARPSDYGQIVLSRFKLRPVSNLRVCRSLRWRRYLSDCWQRPNRASRNRHRQY